MFHCYKKCPTVVHAPKGKALSSTPTPTSAPSPTLRNDSFAVSAAENTHDLRHLSAPLAQHRWSYELSEDYCNHNQLQARTSSSPAAGAGIGTIDDISSDATMYMSLDYFPSVSASPTQSQRCGASIFSPNKDNFHSQGAQLASMHVYDTHTKAIDAEPDNSSDMMDVAASESYLLAGIPGTAFAFTSPLVSATPLQFPSQDLGASIGTLSFEQYLALQREELRDDHRHGLVDQHRTVSLMSCTSSHSASELSASTAAGYHNHSNSRGDAGSEVASALDPGRCTSNNGSENNRRGALSLDDEDLYVWVQAARLLSLSSSSTAVTSQSEDDVAEDCG